MIYTIGYSGKKFTLTVCTASQISTNNLAASERPGMGARSRKSDPRTSSTWATSKETLRTDFICSRNALGGKGEGKGEIKDAQEMHKRWSTYFLGMILCFCYFW